MAVCRCRFAAFARVESSGHESVAHAQAVAPVELEQGYRDTADGRQGNDSAALQPEVPFPTIPPRVEEADDSAVGPVNGREVASLMAATAETRPGQVSRLRAARMFRGNHMIRLVGKPAVVFMEQAVLTAPASPIADKGAQQRRHLLAHGRTTCRPRNRAFTS
jgi:hypothetical protein